ncbi:XdhC family protein [Candidatus Poribacteria bacterium]|nr:XdhC family protein [Candidatus Poribacteria bacterium]
MEIFEEVLRLKREEKYSAIATIVQCIGSAPQKTGAKMLVRDDGTTMGTLGGGCIEAQVIHSAMLAMRDGSPATVPFNLNGKEGGLVCGGKILVYIEPVVPEPHLVILGAGHVGKALSSLAEFSGFRVTVVDDREEYANKENVPDAHNVVVNDFRNVFSDCGNEPPPTTRVTVDKRSYVVIATRGHNHDLDALRSALKTEACYIGLVGSKRKREMLFKTLSGEGFSDDDIQRVIIPVGLPIGSVTPEEIAISIMAQIIQKRRGNVS